MRTQVSFPDIAPPPHRGMDLKNLDRSAFTLKIPLLAASISIPKMGELKREFAGNTLSLPRIPSVVDHPSSKTAKLLVLDKEKKDDLTSEILQVLERNRIETQPYTVSLGYEYWNANQILRAMLPEDLQDDLPSSFTIVGHIAHFNLREEYLPYKYLIGQVVLDKNPSLRTVVNKLDSIDTEFRFFAMEVLAGPPDFIVTTSENGCTFKFDFSKVYWNSRLQAEHTRLVESFDRRDVLADGFAGVGPFAIPAAKKGCLGVFANDLNPMSAQALQENARINKLDKDMRCYNTDGRDFFRQVVVEAHNKPFIPSDKPKISATKAARLARQEREARKTAGVAHSSSLASTSATPLPAQDQSDTTMPEAQQTSPLGRFLDHFVLNLPATAIDFLDSFEGIYKPLLGNSEGDRRSFRGRLKEYSVARGTKDGYRFPMVHCYCFTKEVEQPEKDICERATKTLGYPVSSDTLTDYSLSLVRSVAPKKDMYRLSFRLPQAVVFGDGRSM